jgi:hypothetical protein
MSFAAICCADAMVEATNLAANSVVKNERSLPATPRATE